MPSLNVGNIQGLSPTFRVDLDEDTTLDVNSNLNISGQSYIPIPSGTNTNRNSAPAFGSVRYNTDSQRLEAYYGPLLGWKNTRPLTGVTDPLVVTNPVTSGLILDLDVYTSWTGAFPLLDNTSNNLDGTARNTPAYTSDSIGGYIEFLKADSDSLEVVHTSTLNFTTEFTVFWWGSATNLTTWNSLYGKASAGSWNDGWGIYYNANIISFYVNNYSSYAASYNIGGTAFPLTCWVGRYNGANVSLFRNGSFVTSTALTANVLNTSSDLGIGRMNPYSYYSDSNFRTMLVYNRALSDAEISNVYTAYNGRYNIV